MKLFRKKAGTGKAGNDRLASIIATAILKMQTSWADWMLQHSERLSHKSKKAILIICCLLAAGYSTLVIVQGIRGKQTINVRVSSIHKPIILKDNLKPQLDTSALIRIHRFRNYMDSLIKDTSGRQTADSIMKARPGLLDSLRYVEQQYQSQLKNSK